MPTGVYKRKPLTEEHKDSISKGLKGKMPKNIKQIAGWNKGIKGVFNHTDETKTQISKTLTGKYTNEKSHKWKGDNVGYQAIHGWLKSKFGKAKQCEHCGVLPEDYRTNKGLKSKLYPIEYALKKSCKYERKRECFIELCFRCHMIYDWTQERQQKVVKNLHWHKE